MQLAQRQSFASRAGSSKRVAACTTRVLPVVSSRTSSSSRSMLCRAEPEQSPSQPTATEQQPEQPKQPDTPAAAPSAPLLAKGQGTAIVTGAISIIFGIAYLVLVQLLDMRGGELQPPPPEAFIP